MNQKVAIITGASGGIGQAVAIRLASDGFAVVVHYSGNTEKAQATVSKIESHSRRAIAMQANVAEAADIERLFAQTIEQFGSIDVVVNCAGIMPSPMWCHFWRVLMAVG